jgi:hypothetical protein
MTLSYGRSFRLGLPLTFAGVMTGVAGLGMLALGLADGTLNLWRAGVVAGLLAITVACLIISDGPTRALKVLRAKAVTVFIVAFDKRGTAWQKPVVRRWTATGSEWAYVLNNRRTRRLYITTVGLIVAAIGTFVTVTVEMTVAFESVEWIDPWFGAGFGLLGAGVVVGAFSIWHHVRYVQETTLIAAVLKCIRRLHPHS